MSGPSARSAPLNALVGLQHGVRGGKLGGGPAHPAFQQGLTMWLFLQSSARADGLATAPLLPLSESPPGLLVTKGLALAGTRIAGIDSTPLRLWAASGRQTPRPVPV